MFPVESSGSSWSIGSFLRQILAEGSCKCTVPLTRRVRCQPKYTVSVRPVDLEKRFGGMYLVATLLDISETVRQEEQRLLQGGGKSGADRQRKLGRLPVRERLLHAA